MAEDPQDNCKVLQLNKGTTANSQEEKEEKEEKDKKKGENLHPNFHSLLSPPTITVNENLEQVGETQN